MAQPNGTTQTITGTVEAVNERGIKINGRPQAIEQHAHSAYQEARRGNSVSASFKAAWTSAASSWSSGTIRLTR
jgi:hypothetical protein